MHKRSTEEIKTALSSKHEDDLNFDLSSGDNDTDHDLNTSEASSDSEVAEEATPDNIIRKFERLTINRDFIASKLDRAIKHLTTPPNHKSYFILHLLLKLDPEITLPTWALSTEDAEQPNRETCIQNALTEAVKSNNALANTLKSFYRDGPTDALCAEILSQFNSHKAEPDDTFLAFILIVSEHLRFNHPSSKSAAIPIGNRERARTTTSSSDDHPFRYGPNGKSWG